MLTGTLPNNTNQKTQHPGLHASPYTADRVPLCFRSHVLEIFHWALATCLNVFEHWLTAEEELSLETLTLLTLGGLICPESFSEDLSRRTICFSSSSKGVTSWHASTFFPRRDLLRWIFTGGWFLPAPDEVARRVKLAGMLNFVVSQGRFSSSPKTIPGKGSMSLVYILDMRFSKRILSGRLGVSDTAPCGEESFVLSISPSTGSKGMSG